VLSRRTKRRDRERSRQEAAAPRGTSTTGSVNVDLPTCAAASTNVTEPAIDAQPVLVNSRTQRVERMVSRLSDGNQVECDHEEEDTEAA
jgi:hypothetical protein